MANKVLLPEGQVISLQILCDQIGHALFQKPEKSDVRILYKIYKDQNGQPLKLDRKDKLTWADARKLFAAWGNLSELKWSHFELPMDRSGTDSDIIVFEDFLSEEQYKPYKDITDCWDEDWSPYATFDANYYDWIGNLSEVDEVHTEIVKNKIINKELTAVGQYHEPFDDPEGRWSEHIFLRRIDVTHYIESIGLEVANASVLLDDKPLGNRERDTLLSIIAALCKEAKLDYTKPAKTAGLIQSTAAGMGISIGETTIENHLKKISNALATRTR